MPEPKTQHVFSRVAGLISNNPPLKSDHYFFIIFFCLIGWTLLAYKILRSQNHIFYGLVIYVRSSFIINDV